VTCVELGADACHIFVGHFEALVEELAYDPASYDGPMFWLTLAGGLAFIAGPILGLRLVDEPCTT
jgi:hypothetical protein